ncbi:hypothetical protein ZYGM_000728 [Zygosaccharomyces mellis]|uniref:NAD(P)-binding protein n=1 Tax=Zygosaccharomyces mellis TaxID=42258 RepID=A0A4C2E0I6_9SACH|nr:hypothetical protein ZYGM_000728 [Zygosaccharomyces mellis]
MTEPAPGYSKINWLYEMYYGFRPNQPKFLPKDYPDLTGKAAIVTGSNTGIGASVVQLLYEKNCDVISVVRTEEKGLAAREKTLKEIPNSKGSITVVGGCDFLDLNNVRPTAHKVTEILKGRPLNIIIHNAGLMSPVNTGTSVQGYEAMFSTNVMGPQLLQHFLDPIFLKKDDPLKRIVWVSSCAHLMGFKEYGINWENPTFEGVPIKQRPRNMTLYGQTKAANLLQSHAWALKHSEAVQKIGAVSVGCFPGNLSTDLTRDWSFINMFAPYFLGTALQGAYSELYAALSPDLTTKDHGAYVVPYGEVHNPREDITAAYKNGSDLKFYQMVEELISKYF